MTLCQDQDGAEALSHTARHIALGGAAGAPRQLAEGCRWIGGQAAEIDSHLIRKCTEGTEAGKIQGLNFHFTFIQVIAGLDQVAGNLRSLDLSSNNIREIEGLEGMKQLRELRLYGCQISRIQNLDACPSLAALHLEDNHIASIEGLDSLRGLEYLNLDSNRIQSVSRGLARLTKLKELHLSSNRIASVEGLAGLGSLELLSLDHNQIRTIDREHLKGLGKVDELHLAGNQLCSLAFLAASASISGMQPLPSLSSLDVSCNQITSETLRGLPPLSQLTDLNLADNQITELPSGIATSWPSIELLDLSKNQLEKPSQLEQLKPLVALRELLLEGNPLNSAEDAGELPKVLAALADLEYVDDKKVLALLPPPELPALGDEPESSLFLLTSSKIAPSGSEPTTSASTAAGGSRPGTGGSRPSTSSSRPSTTQSLKDAGVRDPLMHMRMKQGEKRFASEEQALQWEKQTMSGLAAVEKQILKTTQMSDNELQRMEKYLQKAQKLFQRQRELQANGYPCPSVPEEPDEDDLPNSPARASRRLREACTSHRVADDDLEILPASAVSTPVAHKVATPSNAPLVSVSTPSAASAPASRPTSGKRCPAAFDEEIEEEDVGVLTPRAPSEIDEEDLGAGVASEAEDTTPACIATSGPVEMRVGVRAAARTKRSGSSGAVGRAAASGGASGARRPPLPAAQRSERVGAPPRSR